MSDTAAPALKEIFNHEKLQHIADQTRAVHPPFDASAFMALATENLEALGIMQRMRDNRHLDPDLYRLFLDAGVWRDYARVALDPEQLDVVDPAPFR